MKAKRFVLLALSGLVPALVCGQRFVDANASQLRLEEAATLLDDNHFFASKQLLSWGEKTAWQRVSDYQLNNWGTAERITDFLSQNPVHPDADRLQAMEANQLVKQGNWAKARGIYRSADLSNLPGDEAEEATLYQAIGAIHEGNLNEAEQLLATLSDSQTHEADIMFMNGYVKYAKGQYEEAAPYFAAVEESDEWGAAAPVYVADCYLKSGQASKAISKARLFRQNNPAAELCSEAKRIEGEGLYDQGQYADAAALLQQYSDEEPAAQRSGLYKLGMSQFKLKNYAKAAPNLSHSAGSASDAMAQNAWLHSGLAYLQTGQKKQAGIAFQQASQMDYNKKVQEEALYNYALSLHDGASMGFGESVSAFETFLNKFPNSPHANSVADHLEEVYFTTQNYPAALASINKIKHPNQKIVSAKQRVLYNLGVQKYADGDYSAAKKYLQQSINTKENAESYLWKGEAEYQLGEYAQATKDLQKYAISSGKNEQNTALAQYNLGYSLFKQKKYAEALPAFQQFCANSSANSSTAMLADAWNRIGDCQLTEKQYAAATQAYAKAKSIDPNQGDYSLLQQANIAGYQNNYQQKVQLLNQLDQEYSASQYGADALFEQGRALVQSGKKNEALNTFNTLISRYPSSANARKASNEIGMIYYENNQTEPAVQAYRQVVEKFPQTEEAKIALGNLKDIYTEQGRVSEYATLAAQVGQGLSDTELDQLQKESAMRAWANGNYQQALNDYAQLEAQTRSAQTRQEAVVEQLQCAKALGNAQGIVDAASKVVALGDKVPYDTQAEALLLRAQNSLALGNSNQAVSDLQALSADTQSAYGAQANVELAQYAYNTQQYSSAEQILNRFTNSGTGQTYWLARGFILLSDVYAQTDRTIEAQQYLLSLKSNYTESEEINSMIEERLQKLN